MSVQKDYVVTVEGLEFDITVTAGGPPKHSTMLNGRRIETRSKYEMKKRLQARIKSTMEGVE
jgi:hypothetical protein